MQSRRFQTESTGDREGAEKRAAYEIGRNPWFIHGWLSAVNSISSIPDRPWEWLPPYTVFGASFDSPPAGTFEEVNAALLTLVRSRAVDAGVLVELHRALDDAAEGCDSISELARYDRRDELYEFYCETTYNLYQCMQLEKDILTRPGDLLELWRQFGDHLGRSIHMLVQYAAPTDIPELMSNLIDLGRRLLLPPSVDELDRLYMSILSNDSGSPWFSKSKNDELIACIQELDARTVEWLSGSELPAPYLVVDDERECVNFLGAVHSYDHFNKADARGGLALLRALAREPGKFMSPQVLIAKSGLGIDPSQLYSYVARVRAVLTRTKSNWPGQFLRGTDHKRAMLAFVRPMRRRKNRAETGHNPAEEFGPTYKLDLPLSRVRYVGHVQT